MEKVYIAKMSIYDEDGGVVYMPNDILDRDYGEDLCYEADIEQLGELVGVVNDALQDYHEQWDTSIGVDTLLEDVFKIMYDITTRQG